MFAFWSNNPNTILDKEDLSSKTLLESTTPLVILGFPVACTENAMVAFAEQATTKASEAIGHISKLHHAQGEATILQMCGPTSRLKHLFRFPLEASVIDTLRSADATTLSHLERVLGRPLSSEMAEAASLPVAAGGLGFSLLRDIEPRSESACALESVDRLLTERDELGLPAESREAIHKYLISVKGASIGNPAPTRTAFQNTTLFTNWRRRLIFESSRAPHASDFLFATPGPGTTLSDNEYRDALWMRLGLSAAEGHDECLPNPQLDPLGTHRLGCPATAGARTKRHDDLVDVIANAALSADPNTFMVAREERLPDDSETQRRPGDVALNLGNGRSLVDLTVASLFSAARGNALRLAGSPAAAAEVSYDRKTRKSRRAPTRMA